MYNDIYNPKGFMFVDEDNSEHGIPPQWETMSDSSGHKSSAPIDLWGEDAFVPIRQKNAKPTPKKDKI